MLDSVITIAAIVALLFAAGYALHRERSRAGLFLCGALLLTALLELFDLLSLSLPQAAVPWKWFSLVAESLLPFFWIMCSLTYARQAAPWRFGPLLKGVIALSLLFCLLPFAVPLDSFFYAPDFPLERLLFLGNVGYFYYLGLMAALIFALVNFETTLANASPESLDRVKFEIIGLGAFLGVLIFYFSQALVYRSLNMNYLQLRSLLYLVGLGLMAYSLLFRRGGVRIQVSRQAAFKSFVLVAVGLYLIMIGLLGEGMQYFGVSFQRTVTVSFAFIAGIVLLLLLLSQRFQREVKVALHKNFYQHKHDYRTQWLRFTEQLATSRSSDELLQRILSAYCDVFGMAGAALFLLEQNRGGYGMTATHNMQPMGALIKPDNSLVRFMVERTWVVNVRDDTPEVMEENGAFFRDNQISFVIPLFGAERMEGFIVLGRVIKEDEVYIYEDYDLMKTIARQASQAILHQRLSEQLSQAREVEAIGNIAAFVAHDLKNLVSNLSLIVENAGRFIQNPDFQQDMLVSLGNTVTKMQHLIGRLRNLGERDHFTAKPVNLLELAEKTARLASGSAVTVEGSAETVVVDENEMQNVIMNLLMNAIEASGPDRGVRIQVGNLGNPYLAVHDQGHGMSADFMRRELFKPFKTTKKKGLGIGLYQCKQTVESFGGRIEVDSEEGVGTTFTIWFSQGGEGGTPVGHC
ncbi:XrtA/PEP-CTERM system histidine kinase PrsK [Pelobacter propionicus]|uniref:histidine kinase n=1 Tax=Pelobacter propionicus (strain DSM 2379 / NBRC 103807 / OttBd1) TaxID=338966 RepID=A1ARS4_PELPD|nr:XrtA/PEP-CTERM system histidine kinase PrsK [Pelobacter propionicus]ABL00045.1 integral membrane sensor signal transduction histidine kinase [Pelobacter propionicus DSM 2379]